MTISAAETRSAIVSRFERAQLSMVLQFVVGINVAGRLRAGQTIQDIATADRIKVSSLLSATQALAQVAGLFDQSGTALTPIGAALLDPSQPGAVAAMVEHELLQQSLWHDLGAIVRTGQAQPGQQDVEMATDEVRLSVLLRAMKSMNPELIDAVAELPTWGRASRILDVAGGHGAFLAAILGRNPDCTGAVLDQPTARAEFVRTIDVSGQAGRASFATCDLSTPDPLAGQRADAVLLCRCLHNFGPRIIEEIIESAARVLRAGGGVCVVVERHLDRDGPRLVPEESALFSAYMAVNCVGGHVPRTEWLMRVLGRVGSTELVRLGKFHSAFICEIAA